MTAPLCAAGAAAHATTPCDGPPTLMVRYRTTDLGGTLGCPHHTAALRQQHPGSTVTDAATALRDMHVWSTHPDLVEE